MSAAIKRAFRTLDDAVLQEVRCCLWGAYCLPLCALSTEHCQLLEHSCPLALSRSPPFLCFAVRDGQGQGRLHRTHGAAAQRLALCRARRCVARTPRAHQGGGAHSPHWPCCVAGNPARGTVACRVRRLCGAGDSRAVLCRASGLALPLTRDHKPNLPGERARVEAVRAYVGRRRVAAGDEGGAASRELGVPDACRASKRMCGVRPQAGGRVELQRCWRVVVDATEDRPGTGLAVSRCGLFALKSARAHACRAAHYTCLPPSFGGRAPLFCADPWATLTSSGRCAWWRACPTWRATCPAPATPLWCSPRTGSGEQSAN